MTIQRYLLIGCIAIGLPLLAQGQDQPSASQNPELQNTPDASLGSTQNANSPNPDGPNPDNQADGNRKVPAGALSGLPGMQIESEDTAAELPKIPALLGGKAPVAGVSGYEKSNVVRAGINIGAAYDDNPLLLSSGAVGNASASIFPNVSIEESSTRARWSLGYAGGLTINQRFTNQNQGSHNLDFNSEFRLSPHVNLRVAEDFAMSTGYFDSGNVSGIGPGSGSPNVSVIAPLATQRSSLTTVESNYHLALNDLVGATGSFYDLHYTDPAPEAGLLILPDSQTATGSAFWLHRLFRGNWGGPSYRFERLAFTGGAETRVHSFYAVDTMTVSKHFSFSAYAGPQLAQNQFAGAGSGTATQSNDWSFAGGVDGGWQDRYTGVFAGYARSISDGGGLLGAVRLQTVHASFRHELVSGWAGAVSASHGSNRSLIPTAGEPVAINVTSAGITVERNVRKSFGFRMGYQRDFQQQVSPTFDASKNRFFVTLNYQWMKPLGM